ncbi:MAG: hypothetical protein VKK59_06255 [Vampirovibrionales bacterium]|nr:hypothetical protein [Vampirovibrionales bacterium]
MSHALVRAQQISVEEASSFSSSAQVFLRGCCSYHGGMAGCEATRMRCADGSLSPHCKCVYDPLTQRFWLGKALLRVQAIPFFSVMSPPITPAQPPCASEPLSPALQRLSPVTVP